MLVDSCAEQAGWPLKIAAGVYAGVGFATERPELARELLVQPPGERGLRRYGRVVSRCTDLLRAGAPAGAGLTGFPGEAQVAGVIGLVGDHVRGDQLERLAVLRPELVLLTLLPYLGFAEAQFWANRAAARWS